MDDVEKQLRKALKDERRSLPASADLLVEAYVSQARRMRDAAERVDEEGLVVAGPKDQPVPHPALSIEKQASAEVARLRKQIIEASRRL